LGRDGEGADGAVIVEKQDSQWAVYRKRGVEREDLRLHGDVKAAYEDATSWVYKICADEGV
jgi:hypothetical protein